MAEPCRVCRDLESAEVREFVEDAHRIVARFEQARVRLERDAPPFRGPLGGMPLTAISTASGGAAAGDASALPGRFAAPSAAEVTESAF